MQSAMNIHFSHDEVPQVTMGNYGPYALTITAGGYDGVTIFGTAEQLWDMLEAAGEAYVKLMRAEMQKAKLEKES